MQSNFHLQWARNPHSRFRTGVSLHSHTLYSKERLDFIYKFAAKVPVLAAALRAGERRYEQIHNGA